MNGFGRISEIVEGLRLGFRYSVSANHDLVSTGIQPRTGKVNAEDFGR